jgi:hypothetical protein
MTGLIQPLNAEVEIVDKDGKPTPQFMRVLQKLRLGVGLTKDSAGNVGFANIAAKTILANKTGATSSPTACTISDILDFVTSTRGSILFRGVAGWQALTPGTANQVLQTNGAGADPTWVTPASGGGKTALASPEGQLSAAWAPGANNYVMKWVIADSAFTINKISFMATIASPTVKFQPFVYACPNAPAGGGALLGSGAQVTGAVAGYNEAPLTASVSITKGQVIWIGVSIITAALNMTAQAGGLYGFAANGGTSVPANPCPALTVQNVANQIYGFWAV